MSSGEPRPADYRVVLLVTFTDPEVASVGMPEEQAGQTGHRIFGGKVEVRSLGKALADSEELDLARLVADAASEEILGSHIVAPAASEMIHESVVSMKAHARVSAVAEVTHAYPTLAEGVKVAACDRLEKRP